MLRHAYNKIRAIDGFCRKWIGKIGSVFVRCVTQVSYRPNMMNKIMPVTRVPMMTPLLQGCDTPASCNAKISGMGQQIDRRPPIPSRLRIRSELDFPSLSLGIEKKISAIATAQMGPLRDLSARCLQAITDTYFMKKIHLHVVRSAIMPPRRGPKRLDMAKTELITPE
jgi:hypothetical protein